MYLILDPFVHDFLLISGQLDTYKKVRRTLRNIAS
jgi:hypothetical protein